MGTAIEALLCPKKGVRGFGVLIHFIGSEKRLATSCHISLNLLRTHAIVICTRSLSPRQPVFPTIFYKQFNSLRSLFDIVPFQAGSRLQSGNIKKKLQ